MPFLRQKEDTETCHIMTRYPMFIRYLLPFIFIRFDDDNTNYTKKVHATSKCLNYKRNHLPLNGFQSAGTLKAQ